MRQAVIRIAGHLDPKWTEWFEGFTVIHTAEGQTLLSGEVVDQAAFYGVIAKLRDLGVSLISVSICLPEHK